jgi:hypothetical protein
MQSRRPVYAIIYTSGFGIATETVLDMAEIPTSGGGGLPLSTMRDGFPARIGSDVPGKRQKTGVHTGSRSATTLRSEFTVRYNNSGGSESSVAIVVKCNACNSLVLDKQINGTRMTLNLYNYKKASLSMRVAAWESCKSLSRRPDTRGSAGGAQSSLDPSTGGASIAPQGSSGSVIEASTRLPTPRHGSTTSILKFMDRVSPEQVVAIYKAVLKFVVENRISFRAVESASWAKLTDRLRPRCSKSRKMLNRRALNGHLLDDMYEAIKEEIRNIFQALTAEKKATMILDGWENMGPYISLMFFPVLTGRICSLKVFRQTEKHKQQTVKLILYHIR